MCSQNKNKIQKIYRISPPVQKVSNNSREWISQTNPIGQSIVPRITIRVTPLQTNPHRTLLPQINAPNSHSQTFKTPKYFTISRLSIPPKTTLQILQTLSLRIATNKYTFSSFFPPTKQILPFSKWPVPSRQLVSPPEARLQGSNLQQRPLVSQLRRPEE